MHSCTVAAGNLYNTRSGYAISLATGALGGGRASHPQGLAPIFSSHSVFDHPIQYIHCPSHPAKETYMKLQASGRPYKVTQRIANFQTVAFPHPAPPSTVS